MRRESKISTRTWSRCQESYRIRNQAWVAPRWVEFFSLNPQTSFHFIPQRKYNDCYSVITSINERVAPVIAKNEKSRRASRDRERKKESEKDKKPREDDKTKESKDVSVESKKDVQVVEVKEETKAEPAVELEAGVKVEESS